MLGLWGNDTGVYATFKNILEKAIIWHLSYKLKHFQKWFLIKVLRNRVQNRFKTKLERQFSAQNKTLTLHLVHGVGNLYSKPIIIVKPIHILIPITRS